MAGIGLGGLVWWLLLVVVAERTRHAQAQLVTYEPPRVRVLGQTFALFDSADVEQGLIDDVASYNGVEVIVFTTTSVTSTFTLPPEVGTLSKLGALYILRSLAGTLPSQMGLLSSLTFLRLEFTQVQGTLPTQLGQLTKLGHLYLEENRRLGGSLPSQLGMLSRLETLDISRGLVAGAIPSQLLLLSSLRALILSDLPGLRVGSVPLLELPSLQSITVRWCEHLGPPLPERMYTLSAVSGVNGFTGTIPSSFVNGEGREVASKCDLAFNRLQGTLPSQIGLATRMTLLSVEHNGLEGTLPSQLGQLSLVTTLAFGSNRFAGSLPSQLALLTGLLSLDLRQNLFSGTIPISLFSLTALTDVGVANNVFQGTVPRGQDVWLADCDNSGVDDTRCNYDCPSCDSTAVQIIRCDWRGEKSMCAQIWGLCVAFACVGMVHWCSARWVVRVRGAQQAQLVASCMFSLLGLCLNVLFIANASTTVRTITLAGLSATTLASFFLAAHVTFARMRARAVVRACACLLYAPSRAGLRLLVPGNAVFVVQTDLVLTVLGSLLQGGFQLGNVLAGDRSTITVASLCVSVVTLVGRISVLAVLYLRQPVGPEDPSAGGAEVELAEKGEDLIAAPPQGSPRGSSYCNWCVGRVRRVMLACGCAAAVSSAVLLVPQSHSQSLARADVLLSTTFAHAPTASSVPRMRSSLVDGAVQWAPALPSIHDSGKQGSGCGDHVLCASGVALALFTIDSDFSDQQFRAAIDEHRSISFVVLFGVPATLPTEIGLLTDLRVLLLSSSSSFPIATQVGALDRLVTLYVNADIEGSVPSQLGRLSSLQQLFLQGGGANGTLPSELRNCPITLAQVDNQGVSGNLADAWSPTTIRSLSVPGNAYSGTLPSQLWSFGGLEKFTARGNSLTGELPTQMGLLTALRFLTLSDNKLSGTVPAALVAQLTNVQILDLSNNVLEGRIPTQVGLMTNLRALDLQENAMEGPLPTQVGLLTLLTALKLKSNRFSGTLPAQVALLTRLGVVTVEHNHFHGGLPFGDTHAARAAWVEACDFSGIETRARECKRDCPGCGFGGILLKGCNESGYDHACLPPYAWVAAVVVYAGLYQAALTKLNVKGKAPRGHATAAAVASSATFAHVCANLLVIFTHSGWVAAVSAIVLGLTLVFRGVVVYSEFVRRENTRLASQSAASEVERRTFSQMHAIEHNVALFAVGFLCSLVDPFTLATVPVPLATTPGHWTRLRRLAVTLVVVNDVPQLALRLLALGEGDTSNELVVACAFTLATLCLLGRLRSSNHFHAFASL